jgi:threonine synthase
MENLTLLEKTSKIGNEISVVQQCRKCGYPYGLDRMLGTCSKCDGPLEYIYEGNYNGKIYNTYDNLWKNMDLIPVRDPRNIFSLGEGGSPIIELEELSPYLNGATLYMMMDSDKNPTGVFKDREASIIMSRCKELNMDNLVFYSTGNTGRSYTHYAAHLGFTTYFFMPGQCHYKNTKFIKKNNNNFIIYVDDNYAEIAPFAKSFAKANGLTAIAPLHDRNEAYATVAYEQFRELPKCDYFVQTIASGMGPIGFLRGHENLIKFGLQTPDRIPRVIGIQSSEMNVMSVAYNNNRVSLDKKDLPAEFPSDLYEPTLNSTNPVNNYPALHNCLKKTNGLIRDVVPEYVDENAPIIVEAFRKRGIKLRTDLEKSILIGFAGLMKLSKEGQFSKGETIMMLASGRGKDTSKELYNPDAVISVGNCDPVNLMQQLNAGLSLS